MRKSDATFQATTNKMREILTAQGGHGLDAFDRFRNLSNTDPGSTDRREQMNFLFAPGIEYASAELQAAVRTLGLAWAKDPKARKAITKARY